MLKKLYIHVFSFVVSLIYLMSRDDDRLLELEGSRVDAAVSRLLAPRQQQLVPGRLPVRLVRQPRQPADWSLPRRRVSRWVSTRTDDDFALVRCDAFWLTVMWVSARECIVNTADVTLQPRLLLQCIILFNRAIIAGVTDMQASFESTLFLYVCECKPKTCCMAFD